MAPYNIVLEFHGADEKAIEVLNDDLEIRRRLEKFTRELIATRVDLEDVEVFAY